MGKIKVDFRNPSVLVARAMVQDGASWRQISWEVKTDDETLDSKLIAGGKLTGGLYEEKARVQNEANERQGGM